MSEIAHRHESQAPAIQAAGTEVTPMQMLQMAVQQGAGLDKLERLMDLQQRWEASLAKKAFHEAVSAFKRNPPAVIKDMLNKQYNSRYSSLANLVNTVNESLSEHGLDARWEFDQSESDIRVTCVLSHHMGHSARVSLAGPPDTSGSKNPIQQIKSTLTYLKAATFEAVTGVASREANADDDGNGAGASPRVSTDQVTYIEDLIKESGANRAQFLGWLKRTAKVDRIENLNQRGYKEAVSMLERKKGENK